MTELPHFTLRVSARARRAGLRVSAREGLVVVIPHRFNPRRIPDLLQLNRVWIQRALQRVEAERLQLAAIPPDQPPEGFSLAALGEEWTVSHQTAELPRFHLTEEDQGLFAKQLTLKLTLIGSNENPAARLILLRRWLKRRAESQLIPWLQALGHTTGLPFSGARISSARTRWGSCSHANRICLNRNLLFLPPALARHVMLHELCHTAEHNHSDKFWALVARFDPDWKIHRRALRDAGKHIPGWASVNR